MKKILAMFAVFFMMLAFNPANAAVYSDVPANYWANKEITAIVNDGILTLQNNAFLPTKDVSRSDFNTALLRTLGHKQAAISADNPFSDVVSSRADYSDILLSSKLKLKVWTITLCADKSCFIFEYIISDKILFSITALYFTVYI